MSVNRDVKYMNVLVATREFQSLFHTCGERVEVEWAAGTSAKE
jgi:hypothetical protein